MPAKACCCESISNKNSVFLLSESPPLPPPTYDVTDRGQGGVVFSRSRRGGQTCTCSHISSVAVSFSIYFAYFIFFESSVLCECSGSAVSWHRSYYTAIQNTCIFVSLPLLKDGGHPFVLLYYIFAINSALRNINLHSLMVK